MKQRKRSSGDSFLFHHLHLLVVLLLLCNFSVCTRAYKNYTVGDSLGWFDNLEKPDVNYQKWASQYDFSLGDFLIFNTDTNHSVVQTYNYTTYTLCDYNDAQDTDTIQWSSEDPSATEPRPETVAVPLVKEGMIYFFSGDYDGEQCKNGQNFKINVTHGLGLPESLKNPNDESPSPTSAVSGDDDSVPDTVIPSNFNFNNPKNQTSDEDDGENINGNQNQTSDNSVSVSLSGSLILLGIAFFALLN